MTYQETQIVIYYKINHFAAILKKKKKFFHNKISLLIRNFWNFIH